MVGQRSILDEWRARLAKYERELNDPASARSWLARAYAKVLRFLLSFYGHHEASVFRDRSTSGAPTMDNWVAEPVGPGKPARSAETVRHAIDSIHQANAPGTKSGPLIDGLHADDLIVVETFTDFDLADYWLLKFTQHGFCPQLERGRDSCRIKIPFKNHAQARAMLDERERKLKTSKRSFNPHTLEHTLERQAVEKFSRLFVRFIIAAIGFPLGGTIGQIAAVCISASKQTTELMILGGAMAGFVLAFWYAGRWVQRLGE